MLFYFTPVLAHPGNTDASGCHTCRTNCPSWGLDYGEYHCHNSKGVTQPEEPIKSTYGNNGTGHTSPAPEYSNNASKIRIKSTNTASDDAATGNSLATAESEDNDDSGAAGAFGGAALIGGGLYGLYRKIKK